MNEQIKKKKKEGGEGTKEEGREEEKKYLPISKGSFAKWWN